MRLYIDPATTSMIIQIVAGVAVTLGAVFGIFFSKIKRLFKKGNKEENKTTEKIVSDEKKIISAEDLLNDD